MALNKCESCPRSCCIDFKITHEITNPRKLEEELQKYPFIRRIDSALILDPFGKEAVVGIYRCDRFDKSTGICRNYETEERPLFCRNTGIKVFPHEECLLLKEYKLGGIPS